METDLKTLGIVILSVVSVTQILKEIVVKKYLPEVIHKEVCILIAVVTGAIAAYITGVDTVTGVITGVLTSGTFGATSQVAKSVGTGILEKKESK